jgi:hypothetical protein
MLKALLKRFIKKNLYVPKEQRYAETIIKGGSESMAAALSLTQDEIYLSKYRETKDLFHDAIKAGQLSREQVLYIKLMLNEFLKDYMKLYPGPYRNDAHEIYSKLKSPLLNNEHYETLIETILAFIKFE